MERHEIQKLIQEQILCRIAFKGERHPYIAPFQYAFLNGSLYFHFTNFGKKMKLLEKDKRVCVEIERFPKDLNKYEFVVLRGTLKVVTDPVERTMVIEKMREYGKQKLSANFLAAHGLSRDDGWASFTHEKPLLIVKLQDVIEEIGLKSPW
jgi:nitroimidazol reductase NimA-like FMN-containing flavoprotein (pyridoxamine 5'-phosphate oxidase superfamily)